MQAFGPNHKRGGWGQRIAWFVALWFGGVATVAVIAYAIRWAIMP